MTEEMKQGKFRQSKSTNIGKGHGHKFTFAELAYLNEVPQNLKMQKAIKPARTFALNKT